MRLGLVSCALGIAALASLAMAPAASAADPVVNIQYYAYVDPVVEVVAGRPVTWKNIEPLGYAHNVVVTNYAPPGGAFVAKTILVCGAMLPGARGCARKDLAKGTYLYTCTIDATHSAAMHGVLSVK